MHFSGPSPLSLQFIFLSLGVISMQFHVQMLSYSSISPDKCLHLCKPREHFHRPGKIHWGPLQSIPSRTTTVVTVITTDQLSGPGLSINVIIFFESTYFLFIHDNVHSNSSLLLTGIGFIALFIIVVLLLSSIPWYKYNAIWSVFNGSLFC